MDLELSHRIATSPLAGILSKKTNMFIITKLQASLL
jgi:hypothetical protein